MVTVYNLILWKYSPKIQKMFQSHLYSYINVLFTTYCRHDKSHQDTTLKCLHMRYLCKIWFAFSIKIASYFEMSILLICISADFQEHWKNWFQYFTIIWHIICQQNGHVSCHYVFGFRAMVFFTWYFHLLPHFSFPS